MYIHSGADAHAGERDERKRGFVSGGAVVDADGGVWVFVGG
jgi:hypothetical protein